MHDTIAAYAGGALPAAIGIVRLSGPQCAEMAARLFAPKSQKPITNCENGKLIYGELFSVHQKTLDLCLAALYRAPRSYTGEDMLELFCHGSPAVIEGALAHAFALGARPARAGEFTERAFLNGKLDLTAAEAVADLIDARSEAAAQNAAAQLGGRLGGPLRAMRAELLALLSHFYAVCDYPDEELDDFTCRHAGEALTRMAGTLEALHDTHARGALLQQGVPVAIIGRPNVGKSSLLNALAGFERAIVTDEEGTTRDVIEQHLRLNGALFRVLDTAGLRDARGEAERIGVQKAGQQAREAALLLCVFDGSRPLAADDERVFAAARDADAADGGRARGLPLLRAAVLNKCDLPPAFDDAALRAAAGAPGFDAVFRVSAKTGQGLVPLTEWLSAHAPRPDSVAVTSARQARLLRAAADDLTLAARSAAQGMTADAFLTDAERAAATLGEITGETASPDIAREIFARFCVGK